MAKSEIPDALLGEALNEISQRYAVLWRKRLRANPGMLIKFLADVSAVTMTVTAVVSKNYLDEVARQIVSEGGETDPSAYTNMVGTQMEFAKACQVVGIVFEGDVPKTREEAFEALSKDRYER